MKGFPNQFSDLKKITSGMQVLSELVERGENPKDDGVFGEALVRGGVAGTGHSPMSVEEYLADQRQKPVSNQSFRTTARALRELFRFLGFIDDSGPTVQITVLGEQAAQLTNDSDNAERNAFWKEALNGMILKDGSGNISHPYQVLLNLIGDHPGISRSMCALALEAVDDSTRERERIARLSQRPEQDVITELGVTQANWDNARKVLPVFAIQLGEVSEENGGLMLVSSGGTSEATTGTPAQARSWAVRGPRLVTPETIGRAGTGENSEQEQEAEGIDAAVVAETNRIRQDRLRRHNLIVQDLSTKFDSARLYETPFDILAVFETEGYLIEVKTLSGDPTDEMKQVRSALGQLLYYEAFLRPEVLGDAEIKKIACFDGQISATHHGLFNRFNIGVIWKSDDGYVGDSLAADFLGDHLSLI